LPNVGVSGGTPYGGSPYVSPLSVPYLRYIEWGNTVFSLKFLKNFGKKFALFYKSIYPFQKNSEKIFDFLYFALWVSKKILEKFFVFL